MSARGAHRERVMKRRTFVGGMAGAAGALMLPRMGRAQDTITLKIGTLAPRRSAWHRVFEAWKGSVAQESGGRLSLR